MRKNMLIFGCAAALAFSVVGCSGGDDAATVSEPLAVDDTSTPATVDPTQVSARPSAGCTSATPVSPGDEKLTLTAAPERWYYRAVPTTYVPTTPVPVVLDLHGYSEGAQVHVAHSDLGTFGDSHGFVTVTPQGEGPVARWDTTLGSPSLAFVGALLDEVEAAVCVDLNRVYVTGLSNGAFMTSAVACEYADRIAAAAPVAGIRDIEGCAPSRPVPVVAFHGTDDQFVPFDGTSGSAAAKLPAPDGSGRTLGEAAPAELEQGPTVPEITADWAVRNGCDPTPVSTDIASDVVHDVFPCPPGAEVELYEIIGGGHTWPGSPFSVQIEVVVGHATMSIVANEIMWAFFEQHPLVP